MLAITGRHDHAHGDRLDEGPLGGREGHRRNNPKPTSNRVEPMTKRASELSGKTHRATFAIRRPQCLDSTANETGNIRRHLANGTASLTVGELPNQIDFVP